MSGAASASTMWPTLLDYSRDESKRILRRLELEAYSSIMTAFRAQGDLNKQKKQILQDLQNVLSISLERHRAEVRRAVNDERLTTVANNMAGCNVSSEWIIEGRRLIPLMPRLVPQTAFTVAANNFATMQAEKNMAMPSPSKTGNKTAASSSGSTSTTSKITRPNSPGSNVVVLPSGMSIHIKGGLNTEEEDIHGKKRRRSSSVESTVTSRSNLAASVSGSAGNSTKLAYTSSSGNTIHGISPMKIIFTKSPAKSHTTISPSQKVILVSNASQTTSPSILQRSISGPITVKGNTTSTTTTTTSLTHTKPSVILPCTTATSSSVTAAAAMSVGGATGGQAYSMSGSAATGSSSAPSVMHQNIHLSKPRQKTITHSKATLQSRPGIVIPMGHQSVHGSPQTVQNIQIKPVTSKPKIHIKQEGSMKIITQGMPTSKIVSVPSAGSPIVVVTTGTATPTVTMVNKARSSITGGQITGKVLNISTHAGGKVISTTGGRPLTGRPTTANVVTVNPKTLQLTAVKTVTGTPVTTARLASQVGGKSNVIVVQKAAHGKHSLAPSGATTIHVSKSQASGSSSSPFEKELVSFIQKQDPGKQVITAQLRHGDHKNILQKGVIDVKKAQQIQIVRQRSSDSSSESGRSSLLAELIQAAGITPECSATSGSVQYIQGSQEEPTTEPVQVAVTTSASKAEAAAVNQWVEYDVADNSSSFTSPQEGSSDTSVIKALLDLQKVSGQGNDITSASHSSTQGRQAAQVAPPDVYIADGSSVLTTQVSSQVSGANIQFLQEETVPTDKNIQYLTEETIPMQKNIQYIQEETVSTEKTIQYLQEDILPTQKNIQYIQEEIVPRQKNVQLIQGDTATKQKNVQFVQEETIVTQENQPIGITPQITQSEVTEEITSPTAEVTTVRIDKASANLPQQDGIELDPQTGMFITSGATTVSSGIKTPGQTSSSTVLSTLTTQTSSSPLGGIQVSGQVLETAGSSTIPDSEVTSVDDAGSRAMDIFSSAIAQAQIDLDSYQFIDEESLLNQGTVVMTPASEPVKGTSQQQQQRVELVTPATASSASANVSILPNTDSKVKVQTLAQKSTIVNASSVEGVSGLPSNIVISTNPMIRISQPQVVVKRCSNVAVTVESSGLDMASLTMDDFTSQRLQERTESATDLQGYGASDSESNLVRLSKRKRKPPPAADDSPPQNLLPAWTRAAIGLLQRVCRFRGSSKEKGDLNAASWFLRPVNAEEAPDYYKIIQRPMDFGTIRKKLENGQYADWSDFEDDMQLVRDNCHSYNPPGHEVRQDCDEVFKFYRQEYEKIQDKWQKTHSYSPAAKRFKFEKSPSKQ